MRLLRLSLRGGTTKQSRMWIVLLFLIVAAVSRNDPAEAGQAVAFDWSFWFGMVPSLAVSVWRSSCSPRFTGQAVSSCSPRFTGQAVQSYPSRFTGQAVQSCLHNFIFSRNSSTIIFACFMGNDVFFATSRQSARVGLPFPFMVVE